MAVVGWVQHNTPRDFGFFRSRWTCELLAEVLWEEHGVRIGERGGPSRRCTNWDLPGVDRDRWWASRIPSTPRNFAESSGCLRTLPADEVAVFQDEVDVHLNPKIGCAWMPVGEQATVETPGNNVKRHLAGSLVWRTGTLLVSPPAKRRNAELFVAHLGRPASPTARLSSGFM